MRRGALDLPPHSEAEGDGQHGCTRQTNFTYGGGEGADIKTSWLGDNAETVASTKWYSSIYRLNGAYARRQVTLSALSPSFSGNGTEAAGAC